MFFNKLTLATALAHALCKASADSIYDIAKGNENFSTLVAAVDASAVGPAGPNLVDALSGDGTFTIFAPPNSAFDDLPDELVKKLLEPTWQPQLQDVLLYHALGSEVRSTDLSDGLTTATLSGEDIVVNLDPPRISGSSNILVDDGLVDIEADNGVVHAVSAVLTPTSVTSTIVDIAAGNKAFSTLVAAVKAAGLVEALSGEGPLTVFAPTDDAFAALPDGTVDILLKPKNKDQLIDILTYHVVPLNAHSAGLSSGDVETLNGDTVALKVTDGGVTVNEARVVTPDIIASNGIIHVVDTVLLPPSDDTDSTEAPGTIVDIAAGNKAFSTLVAAVKAAGLVEALSGEGPLTVFAPTDDAFAALPDGTVDSLLKPENKDQLIDILTYHVVPLNAPSAGLSSGDVETLNGDTVALKVTDGGVTVNDARVVTPDIIASNGIIHVVDAVLLPPSDDTVSAEADEKEEDNGGKVDAAAPEESVKPDAASGAGMLAIGGAMSMGTYFLALSFA